MYPSKGSGAYGQQAYGQLAGAAVGARQSMMGATQEADLSGYMAHSAVQGAQYGGPYAAVYGSSALSGANQAGGVGSKGAASSSALQSRYASALPEQSKFSSAALGSNLGMNSDDYVSATSLGRHYGDPAAYLGRDLQNDPARRYADSISISQQHQADMHDHMDQASLLRQQQMLKAQSLQSTDMRQAEYLAARTASIHHGSQEYGSYTGRMDIDSRSLPILGSAPYGSQHTASILGGAPRRNVDELYTQGSSSAAYGVGLPPGRDYGGKGLHGSLESDYQALTRGHPNLGVSIVDERNDDRAYRRELERDEERRRELIREKEKERERDERERQREKERERERLLERRERERERDRKRALDDRRERTPPRSTRDRRGSSLLKDERTRRSSPRRASPRRASPRRASPRRTSPRRASPRRTSPRRASPRRTSPRREALRRPRSPVRETKKEYMCKVFPFSLVEVERDYLSLNKRYPRLFISPECSKVILYWPKQTLHLSLHTPVSFEHKYMELDSKGDEKALVPSDELSKLNHGNTVWNVKVILMSGMSTDVLNEMCSYKSSDDRIVHFNTILKFAILKKDHSFMAIGGPWNAAIDGGDPLVEDSSLIRTASRYLKDATHLDLQSCQHWNRFLEIHYDRVGEDGMFSHKEITVLFVPDLSECLPTLDAWRTQWLAHQKEVAHRERQLSVKDKRSSEKKESGQEKVKAEECAGKGTKIAKTDSDVPMTEKDADIVKGDDTKGAIKESNKNNVVDQRGKVHQIDEKPIENVEGAGEECKTDVKSVIEGANADASLEKPKTVKKKVIKKVVKGKADVKKITDITVEVTPANPADKADVKNVGDKQIKQENVEVTPDKADVKNVDDKQSKQETVKEKETPNPVNVKTFTRKKIVKKVLARKPVQTVDKIVDTSANQTDGKKIEPETLNQDVKMIEKESDEAIKATTNQETAVKTSGKKKIIRRVIKRKVSGAEAVKKVAEDADVAPQIVVKKEETNDQVENKDVVTSNLEDRMISVEPKTLPIDKDITTEKKEKTETQTKKESTSTEKNYKPEEGVPKSSADSEVPKDKDSKKDDQVSNKERTKDEKENKSKDGKHDSKQKSPKVANEKGKSEEPPQHPGLFLQTKRIKGSKIPLAEASLSSTISTFPPMAKSNESAIPGVIRIAVASRLLVVTLIVVWRILFDPYDTSASLNPPCLGETSRPSDSIRWPKIGAAIESSVVWDGVYFVRIAECGYEYEQTYAFFPLLPISMVMLSKSVFALLVPMIGYRAVLALSGYVVSNVAFVLAAVFLYRLSVLILKDSAASFRACVLFCFNPASIFYSSVYSESLYALSSLGGLFYLFNGANTIAMLLLALSGAARSNGAINAGYFCFQAILQVYDVIIQKKRHILAMEVVLAALVRSIFIFAPFIGFQAYGYLHICKGGISDELRPWCNARIPLLYGFLQSHYWGVGFLRYFQVKQLPNFLLASPILSLAVCSISWNARSLREVFQSLREGRTFSYMVSPVGGNQSSESSSQSSNTMSSKSLGVNTVRRRRKESQELHYETFLRPNPPHEDLHILCEGYNSVMVLPFLFHLGFMTFTAFFVMYVQVATRFLSTSPPIYWFASYLLESNGKTSRRICHFIWVYFIGYILLGSLLFSNFYPFT